MAASTIDRSIRVRLLFQHIDIGSSWFCVSLKENMHVSDMEKRIISKFGLGQNNVELFVSGCRLPSWETICVLRENDTVHVSLQQPNGQDVHTHASAVNSKKGQQEKIRELEQQCDKSDAPLDSNSCCIANKDSEVSSLGTVPYPSLQKQEEEILEVLDDAVPHEHQFYGIIDGKKEPHIKGKETMEAGELKLPEEPTRKRKRKRKRKNKSNEFQIYQSIENGTLLEESSEEPLPILEEIKMTLPQHKQPNNKHKTYFEDTIPSDTSPDHSVSKQDDGNSNFPLTVCHYTEKTVSPTTFTTNQKLVERTRTHEALSPKIKETTLNNGVKVFTREKKMPLTHLNKTINSENLVSGNCKLGSQRQWSTRGSVASEATDYSQYPDLEAPPHRNDNIAFKMVEVAENFCPEISSYKEAEVIAYDPITTKVQLQLSSEYQHMGEWETFNLDASKSPASYAGCIVTLNWDSLVEPKLLC